MNLAAFAIANPGLNSSILTFAASAVTGLLWLADFGYIYFIMTSSQSTSLGILAGMAATPSMWIGGIFTVDFLIVSLCVQWDPGRQSLGKKITKLFQQH